MASNVQTLRFRGPTNKPAPVTDVKPKNRHGGILQDQLRRAQKGPWVPSFSTALRILLLVRVTGAMFSNIQDCDEVFNFWEPLHYLDRGYGFQTWETSPAYSIRSWAYILLHLIPVKAASLLGPEKRPAFFAVRILLGFISSLCEVFLYRTIVEKINYRVGRYFFFMLACSAGMWTASTAFLPSSFAMYTTTLGFALSLQPTSSSNMRRTMYATLAFAVGAIVGWPYTLAIAIPFVFEELFLASIDPSVSFVSRWSRMFVCGGTAALLFIPVVAIDTLFYGKLSVVPWNAIKYNIFPDSQRGPGLYGTESIAFYFFNLLLNFNILVPLAALSLPALAITQIVDRKRLGDRRPDGQSSAYTLIGMRLAPVYLWIAILSAQPHKEERFLFPIYPLICFNAAVSLYLVRGWMEVAYIKITNSPYKASQESLFGRFTLSVVTASMVFSLSRILAHYEYYHAPMSIAFKFETEELPRFLNTTGHITLPSPRPANATRSRYDDEDSKPRIDYSPIKDFDLRLCLGKEWYRFPGHFLIPDGVQVRWIKSEFDGMLPGHFQPTKGGLLERQKGTKFVPAGLNDLNKEAPEFYVDVASCDYLVDLDFPQHPVVSANEPRYVTDEHTWDRITCLPFLDARHSSLLTRTLWLPGARWEQANVFGEYCLLRNRENVAKKEKKFALKNGQ